MLAAGEAPYTLAVGFAGSKDVYLTLRSLAARSGDALPDADVAASPISLPLKLIDHTAADSREVTLWAILLGATALLAGMAWMLWRRTTAAD